MKNTRNQAKKANEDKFEHTNIILKNPGQVESNIINQEVDHQKKKTFKEQDIQKRNRQCMISQMLMPQNFSNQFYSPKSKKAYDSPSICYMSANNTKQTKGLTKSTSLNNLFGSTENMRFINKNKQVLNYNKTKVNSIENHKKTLQKIEQILSKHGIQVVKQSIAKSPKEPQKQKQQSKKIAEAPKFQKHLTSEYQNQIRRKQTVSFGNDKKSVKESNIKPIELKQTVSTSYSYKNLKQTKISDFQIGKQIGRGTFGNVKIVRHKKTGLVYALKIIKKSVIKKQKIITQLIKQIKIQYFLNQANIVKLYTVFDDNQFCYLLLQLCIEGNLYQRLLKQHYFSQNQARKILKNICEGLAQLHENKIIHRDLKPQNIVFSYGLAKLCDLGWSTQNKDSLRQTFCGTPLYVSPQLLSGNSYDEKVDLWSIGVLGFQLLTGHIPFNIKTEKDLTKIIDQKIVYPKNLSSQAVSFLQDLLSKQPNKRKSISQILNNPFFKIKNKNN